MTPKSDGVIRAEGGESFQFNFTKRKTAKMLSKLRREELQLTSIKIKRQKMTSVQNPTFGRRKQFLISQTTMTIICHGGRYLKFGGFKIFLLSI